MSTIANLTRPVIYVRITEYLTQHPGQEFTSDHLATVCLRGHVINTPDEVDNFRRRIYFALRALVKISDIQQRAQRTAFKKRQLLYYKPTQQSTPTT